MIKLKVSYEHKEELQGLISLFYKTGNLKEYRQPNKQEGKYKKAYITLTNNGRSTEKNPVEPRTNHGEFQK